MDVASLKHEESTLIGDIQRTTDPSSNLHLKVFVTSTGAIRIQMYENVNRWQPSDILQQEGLIPGKYSVISNTHAAIPSRLQGRNDYIALLIDNIPNGEVKVLIIYSNPLKFELYHNDVLAIAVNERSLLHFEKTQSNVLLNLNNDDNKIVESLESTVSATPVVDKHQGKEIVGYGEDGLALYADGSKEIATSMSCMCSF